MQRLGGDGAPLVVVDYAHTPDALEKVLRGAAAGRGRRRRSSSACSAAAAIAIPASGRRWARSPRALADRVVVTSDNPRSEDPAAIAERDRRRHRATPATAAGASSSTARRAIARAIAGARAGDVVLIAGKGHEDYQERDGVRTPFSDADAQPRARAGGAGAAR